MNEFDAMQIFMTVAEQAPTAIPLLWVIWRLVKMLEMQNAELIRICGMCVEDPPTPLTDDPDA